MDKTVRFYLDECGDQVCFWYSRFMETRDVEDLERAERFAEPLREIPSLQWGDSHVSEIFKNLKALRSAGPDEVS